MLYAANFWTASRTGASSSMAKSISLYPLTLRASSAVMATSDTRPLKCREEVAAAGLTAYLLAVRAARGATLLNMVDNKVDLLL